ncbi:hypothetical protein LAX5112_04516 [Roseibium alexandrii]|uniref:GIY-YIG domain-containing protein n=1 Tax=Roseibium alexandrii TaxID=388408 RepID=A0A0M7ARJ3_9HYPH|nr:hypothetical protein LAX5112_04516 [Roseibium alexandrii]
MKLLYKNIEFDLDFHKGRGGEMPSGPGIYAEIHWPTNSLRIGESKNIKSRNRGHISWANRQRSGQISNRESRRKGPIVDLAKRWGAEGLEHFLISNDERLVDRELRVECEKYLHHWAKYHQRTYRNLNRQRGYRISF